MNESNQRKTITITRRSWLWTVHTFRQIILALVITGWGIETIECKGAAARGGGGHGESK